MSPPSNALKSRVNNHSAKGRSSSDTSPQLINQIPAVSVPLCAVELSSGYCPTKGCRCIFSELVLLILPLDQVVMTVFIIPAGKKPLLQEHDISQLDFYSSRTLYF